MTDVPVTLRQALSARAAVRTLRGVEVCPSADGSAKHTFITPDGHVIESVYLPYRDRVSICLSSQVGCPAACAFCATGRFGLLRQLTAGEIVEQYLAVQDAHPNQRISHAVFMGMGEPLLNLDAVVPALRLLIAEVQLSARNLTVSTVGVVPGIRRLADQRMPVNLAVSLHAPDDELRGRIVPTASKWSLAEILAAARYYRDRTGRDVTYEYVLLSGVNDGVDHARTLARLLGDERGAVDLIPYNPVEGLAGFRTPARVRVTSFRQALRDAGRAVTERRRRGHDTDGACGQLAGASRGLLRAPDATPTA
jgi:23S rRNA (adenine2503-C2)-methyltransferase